MRCRRVGDRPMGSSEVGGRGRSRRLHIVGTKMAQAQILIDAARMRGVLKRALISAARRLAERRHAAPVGIATPRLGIQPWLRRCESGARRPSINRFPCNNRSLLECVDGSDAFDRRSDGVACDARDKKPLHRVSRLGAVGYAEELAIGDAGATISPRAL